MHLNYIREVIFRGLHIICLWITSIVINTVLSTSAIAQTNPSDTIPKKSDTLHFPLKDRYSDRITNNNKNPFYLSDTSFLKQHIEYDPKTKQYYIIEKIGNTYYRKPTSLSDKDFLHLKEKNQEQEYFNQRSDALFNLNRRYQKPKLQVTDNLFNRMFGSNKVDIKPNGYVDVSLGYQGQRIDNPILPERARHNGGLDFNLNAQLNVNANIGNKLKFPINYNTLANFSFENQIKLEYKGDADEIIKSLEAGNISYTSKGSLMPSAQSLFGIKAQLQFGRLFLTGVLANQRAQRQTLTLQGGNARTTFIKNASDYDENRHFLLAQYFRNNYNKAMQNLPAVNSQIQILRVEVWITNRSGLTTDTRNIVGLMDLGEYKPYNANINSTTTNPIPQNSSNGIYGKLANNPAARNPTSVNNQLIAYGLQPVQDYEKIFARKLAPSEYTFNPQIGFISINQQLQPDDVLAIAYQYTYNGRIYQVGEFSQDVALDSSKGVQNVLFLKLLKATSQKPSLPIWQLMMKNIYSLDVAGLQRQDFSLNILYQEPSAGEKRYLPEGDAAGKPLLSVLQLDRLNNQNDPQPDGMFDYIEGYTVLSQQGKIVFPVLEPFGKDLEALAFATSGPALKQKYIYYQLYDTIKVIAQTYANLNRFQLKGYATATATSDIYLGGFNIPQGSVIVTAGGQVLQENIDYTVNYSLGTLKILNQAILNSGIPVNVQFENSAAFGIQQRSFLGLQLDYQANKELSLGLSMARVTERPFYTKVNYGDDPIKNTMYGSNFNYQAAWPTLTKWLNKLPFFNSKAASHINAYGEIAILQPGHPGQIGSGTTGTLYIDDFEGSRSEQDMRFPAVSWTLASTPQGNGLFPEASLSDSIDYGFNRAKLAWYNIEPVLQDRNSSNNPIKDLNLLSDPRTRAVSVQEIFPQRTPDVGQNQLVTFDLGYYPTEKGPYNYDARIGSVDANGKLLNPKKRWGGIMRSVDQTDFETANVEFMEFWVQDPFIKNPASNGGSLYINLGNVSEDILRDGRRFYENGLSTPSAPTSVDSSSTWGNIPANPIQVTQAFSTDPNDRPFQDVGFDGLNDDGERRKRNNDYLNKLATTFGVGSNAYKNAFNDPSIDNYTWYRDPSFDVSNANILTRYKNYNNPQGNSPVSNNNTFSPAATVYPDNEDLNRDNTLNETEQYFQYKVDLKPNMQVGSNFITDKRIVPITYANGSTGQETWYLFRVPIQQYEKKVGTIQDFKSIRFMRLFLTNFEDSATLRFASLDFVRNQWRQFQYKLDTTGNYIPLPPTNTSFNVLAVNVEENSSRSPIPYVIPPGIERVQQLNNNNTNVLLNEQAMSLQIRKLAINDARAVFKNVNLDLRRFRQLSMFIHAETAQGAMRPVQNNDLVAVMRIGSDFLSNYYEIRIPLKITQPGQSAATDVWPVENNMDFSLGELTAVKTLRNSSGASPGVIFRKQLGNKTFSLLGNPNLGQAQVILFGVENHTPSNADADAEVWINELRLSSIDQRGGWAGLGRVDIGLSDLGNISISGNYHTTAFGSIDQHINERAKDDLLQFDVSTNLELGKLLPSKTGLSIPFYANISRSVSTPEFDPYDLDIRLKDKLNSALKTQRDSIRNNAIDQSTTKTFNFTNVRKNNIKGKKLHFWDIENVDVSYSYTQTEISNPLVQTQFLSRHHGNIGYTYNSQPKYIEPFKHLIRTKSSWLAWAKNFNFNFNPSLLSIRVDIDRQFGKFIPRIVNSYNSKVSRVDTTYDKYFTYNRYYNLNWNLSRSLNIDFNAINNARIDEPYGAIDNREKRQIIQNNFLKWGRNTLYIQKLTSNYTLPTNKLPLTDWMTIRLSYTTNYNWIGASRLAINLGNTIENSQERSLLSDLDFMQLYNKSAFLRKLTTGNKENVNGSSQFAGKLLTTVKRLNVQYSEIFHSRIPGFLNNADHLGNDWRNNAPGLNYILGAQPSIYWLNRAAAKGWITKDTNFNFLFQQSFEQKLSATAQLEPFKNLIIDLNIQQSFSKSYNELFKDTLGTGKFTHLSPYNSGGFSVSYIAFNTLFEKFDPNTISNIFRKFENNRIILSERLAASNPYWKKLPAAQQKTADGFYTGYGRYAQDVLIPSFIAAYTNANPSTVPLIKLNNTNIRSNPFANIIPKPNWHITYTGLTKLGGESSPFTNITITHGYNSTLSMNSFTSALLYQDPSHVGYPGFIDSVSGNFIPFFLVPNLTINEQFSPLIGIDLTTKEQLTTRFEFRKSRQLSLSLIDYQLSEVRSTEYVFSASWRKRGLKVPFKIKIGNFETNKLSNDINFRLDLSFRNDVNANSRLDQDNAFATGGQRVIRISPSIDYVLSNRINLKLFFDQQKIIPYISSSPPVTTTRAGIQVRVALAQ